MLLFRRIVAAVIALSLAACTPPAHVDLPFKAAVKGSVLETQFTVPATEGYGIELDLYFKENNPTDRDRVKKLAGTGAYDGSGPGARQIDTGLAIPVRLTMTRVREDGESAVLDGVFTNHDLRGFTANYYTKNVAATVLEPGTYRVRIEALQDVPELNDVPVHLDIHSSRRK